MAESYSITPLSHSDILSCHSVIIHFPIIISTPAAHIQLKFDLWMFLMNIQLAFEFRSVLIILIELCLLNFKKMKNLSFRWDAYNNGGNKLIFHMKVIYNKMTIVV